MRLIAGAALAIAGAIGCGPSRPAAYPLQGEPLPKGTMTLIPQSSTARTTVAPIVDGKYSMELTEGTWTVNVQAVRLSEPVNSSMGKPPREQYLPATYNRESQLTVTVPTEQGEHNLALDP